MTLSSVHIREGFWESIQKNPKKYAHIIMIATKPDIIKQAPLYLELIKRGELVILAHTGQHYDYNLSEGVLEEFGMQVDIQLNISGKLHEKFSQIIERLWNFLLELSEKYEKIPVPYVHGDTLTATTADKAAFLNKFAVVHVEAGIRTFTPNEHFYHRVFTEFEHGAFDWEWYYHAMQNNRIYELGSIEPYPEQFDTRGVEPSTGYFAVPHEIYKRTLIDEGFSSDRIEVVGNTVSDAVRLSCMKIPESRAFDLYPNMRGKKLIFITIHRRENCEVRERFMTIYHAIKKLVQEWYPVCFLGLNASESAIDRYGLRRDIEELHQTYGGMTPKKPSQKQEVQGNWDFSKWVYWCTNEWEKLKIDEEIRSFSEGGNFAYGPALAHHHEVMDMITHAGCVMTDSGSMQEEANIVGVPCVTVRFGSDRSETLLAGANVLAPPVNARLITEITKWAYDNPNMRKGNLYGENVSEKIVDGVKRLLEKEWKLFRLDHERLGVEKYFNWDI
jgi:UDP-N-acetylglucosamine 2-epimerase (non-hydrolysing)